MVTLLLDPNITCNSYLLLLYKLPPYLAASTSITHYLFMSVCQESGCSVHECTGSESLTKVAVMVPEGSDSSDRELCCAYPRRPLLLWWLSGSASFLSFMGQLRAWWGLTRQAMIGRVYQQDGIQRYSVI